MAFNFIIITITIVNNYHFTLWPEEVKGRPMVFRRTGKSGSGPILFGTIIA